MKDIMAVLSPILGDELAAEIILHRKAKPSGKRFDSYRAKLTLESFMRSPEPKVAAWEYLNRAANLGNPSQEYVKACVIYHESTGAFESRIARGNSEAGEMLGALSPTGYVVISLAGKTFLAHRLAWFYVYGVWPEFLDHIDRIGVNNELANLRECTIQQNNWNLSVNSRNTSGVTGVHWDKQRDKWMATININGKTKGLGRFDLIEDAQQAYKSAVSETRGHFLGELA